VCRESQNTEDWLQLRRRFRAIGVLSDWAKMTDFGNAQSQVWEDLFESREGHVRRRKHPGMTAANAAKFHWFIISIFLSDGG
jgi:hypothetical protein